MVKTVGTFPTGMPVNNGGVVAVVVVPNPLIPVEFEFFFEQDKKLEGMANRKADKSNFCMKDYFNGLLYHFDIIFCTYDVS